MRARVSTSPFFFFCLIYIYTDPLVTPLIAHTSHPVETHYFAINAESKGRILLHSHLPAPYVASAPAAPRSTLNFTVYSSGTLGCNLKGFSISIDWSATLGRWAARYPTTLVGWAVGVVAVVLFTTWSATDRGAGGP